MSKVSSILSAHARNDPQAACQLLPLVYEELRRLAATKMARESAGQTLDATALVHEAYLRLVGGDPGKVWAGRAHFFAAAAEAMRRILVEKARAKHRLKRGGELGRVDIEPDEIPAALSTSGGTSCWPSMVPSTGSPWPTRPRPSWSSCVISPGFRSSRRPKSWASPRARPTGSGAMPAPGCAARSRPNRSAGRQTRREFWRDFAPDVALNGEPAIEHDLDRAGSRENSR